MRISLLALVLGFIIDLLIGDPQVWFHPIRLIGNLIAFLEKHLNDGRGEKKEFLWGIVMVVLVVILSTGIPVLLLLLAQRIHPLLRLLLESVMCWQLLATRSLRDESMKVYEKLHEKDLEGARTAVSMIVGRDTQRLDACGVTKAAVETIAENTSDGIIAPMFYMAIGGAALGFFYKSINTMDSMVGYKNERYLYFGRFAAKLDDVVNFIPARLAALFMIASCRIVGLDAGSAWKIFLRDRKNHASPNSAQTEAVMAGALRVQLAGDAWYFGKLHRKKTIGDAIRPVKPTDIIRANRLLYATASVALACMTVVKSAAIILTNL